MLPVLPDIEGKYLHIRQVELAPPMQNRFFAASQGNGLYGFWFSPSRYPQLRCRVGIFGLDLSRLVGI